MIVNPLILLEAATRFELVNNGFADRCLSHLAMPPKRRVKCRSTGSRQLERETGLEPATTTLATWSSTS